MASVRWVSAVYDHAVARRSASSIAATPTPPVASRRSTTFEWSVRMVSVVAWPPSVRARASTSAATTSSTTPSSPSPAPAPAIEPASWSSTTSVCPRWNRSSWAYERVSGLAITAAASPRSRATSSAARVDASATSAPRTVAWLRAAVSDVQRTPRPASTTRAMSGIARRRASFVLIDVARRMAPSGATGGRANRSDAEAGSRAAHGSSDRRAFHRRCTSTSPVDRATFTGISPGRFGHAPSGFGVSVTTVEEGRRAHPGRRS